MFRRTRPWSVPGMNVDGGRALTNARHWRSGRGKCDIRARDEQQIWASFATLAVTDGCGSAPQHTHFDMADPCILPKQRGPCVPKCSVGDPSHEPATRAVMLLF